LCDTEKFITEIEKKTSLYDKNMSEFSIRAIRDRLYN